MNHYDLRKETFLMWNKRKEEEYPPKSGPTPAAPANQTKENPPMSTAPAASHHVSDSRGPAVIGKSVMIKGQIFSREDLTIDGEVEGSVELHEHRLTVGPHGKLQAGVKAREIVVLGSVHGNVEASDKIDIRKDARLVGDIKTARIVIEDGAYFKGSIDITRPETTKPAAAPAPKPVVSTSSPSNAAAVSAPAGDLNR
jgi:cytoskeletal protein CcmA (bactofilin family)